MLCERCGKEVATFNRIQVVNGKKMEVHLCSKCAKELGYFGDDENFMGDIISSIFGGGYVSPIQLKEKTCPKCGTRLTEVTKSGYLGCSNCYEEFKEFLTPMLRKLQPNVKHIGKTPNSQNTFKEMNEIDKLRMEMKQAVDAEDFEKACVLREKIKKLQGGER